MQTNTESKKGGLEYWKQIIILFCLGWVVIWIYRTTLSPLFNEIQATIGPHTGAQMGLISSFYFFGYTGMQMPAGFLVDKIGKKAVLIPGFILFSMAAIFIGTATSINMIYIGSLMAGIGCGSYYGAAYSLTAENIPQERRTLSTAIINSGSAIGMAIGLMSSSYFVKSAGLPWQGMLFVVSALILCMVFAFAFVIRPSKKNVSDEVVPSGQKAAPKSKAGLFAPKMIASYALYFTTCYGYYMMVTWLPSFLQNERGFQGIAIGSSSALVAFASIPGALFFSRMSDKFRNKKSKLIIFLEISAAAMLTLVVLAPSSSILLVGLILYGLLGKLAVDPILISYVSENASKESLGTSLGFFNFFGMSSSVLAPVVTGLIADKTGSQVMGFYASAILLIIGTSIFVLANMKKNTKVEA